MKKKYRRFKSEITSEFPPFCPHCGSRMIWQSDFMLSECGYIDPADMMTPEELEKNTDENGILLNDRVVHIFACPEETCEATADYEDLEDDGNMALLSLCLNSEDDPDELEPDLQYSRYAQEMYNMTDSID